MAAVNECAGCGGSMTRGFVLDHGDYNYKFRQMWVEGAPESSFWSGIKTSDRTAYSVDADRCKRCGRLELYAAESVDLSSIFS